MAPLAPEPIDTEEMSVHYLQETEPRYVLEVELDSSALTSPSASKKLVTM